MKRAGILAIGCALAMSTGAFAQSGAPGQPPPSGTSGTPGTTGPDRTGTQGPIGAGTDQTMPNDQQNDQQRRAQDTQEFIKKAAIANMAEVQLGQLASTKAESPEVKQFAQKMVEDHTKALDELKQAAGSSGTALPTELDKKHQKLHDKLSQLSGAEFDREYMEAMVDGHKDVTKMLEKGSKKLSHGESASTATGTSGTSTTPPTTGTSGTAGASAEAAGDVSAWASKTLPTVQGHLQEAQQIERSLEAAKKNNNGNDNGNNTGATGTTGSGGSTSGSGSNTPPE